MRTGLVAVAVFLCAYTNRAQGSVRFSNLIPGVLDQPVFLGKPGSDEGPGSAGGLVQLFLADLSRSSTIPLTPPIAYLSGTSRLSKYFDGGVVQIPGTTPGGTATLRVYSWVGTPSFESALARGVSETFVVLNLGGGNAESAAIMSGFRSFTVLVPEPSATVMFEACLCCVALYRFLKWIFTSEHSPQKP